MILKSAITGAALLASSLSVAASEHNYTPTAEVIRNQQEFAADRFGIFIHWGIYSMFAQGEWYLNYGPEAGEYAKAAKGFYPVNFNASEWTEAIKSSGAKYICFTTRHHDGFSMFHTDQNDYNIVDGTPFKRDVLKELSDACSQSGLKLHLYYSHLDWIREDYPKGRTGKATGRKGESENWESYFGFMNAQLKELLTNYGPIRCIWFDGWWDHDEDPEPFDWHLDEQYALIHSLQPGCLIGNNHHQNPFAGEDIQIFERDVPGENTAGYSEQDISRLPLETCQTMNGMWGYKLVDQNYKGVPTLVRYLVKTAGQGANLLLNIGPQPDGILPAAAVERLKGIGEWMKQYGETIYGTSASPFGNRDWGTSTQKGNTLYVHITDPSKADSVLLPYSGLSGRKIKNARTFTDNKRIKITKEKEGYKIHPGKIDEETIDYIVVLEIQ